jgi:hypothetical protein
LEEGQSFAALHQLHFHQLAEAGFAAIFNGVLGVHVCRPSDNPTTIREPRRRATHCGILTTHRFVADLAILVAARPGVLPSRELAFLRAAFA